MKKIFIILAIGVQMILNAQTVSYKCIDTYDSKYWQYFNIDHNSLHFKDGKHTITLYHKSKRYKGDKSIHTFANNRITFYVTKKTNDIYLLSITDNKYTYDCKVEQIFAGPNNKDSIIVE